MGTVRLARGQRVLGFRVRVRFQIQIHPVERHNALKFCCGCRVPRIWDTKIEFCIIFFFVFGILSNICRNKSFNELVRLVSWSISGSVRYGFNWFVAAGVWTWFYYQIFYAVSFSKLNKSTPQTHSKRNTLCVCTLHTHMGICICLYMA